MIRYVEYDDGGIYQFPNDMYQDWSIQKLRTYIGGGHWFVISKDLIIWPDQTIQIWEEDDE